MSKIFKGKVVKSLFSVESDDGYETKINNLHLDDVPDFIHDITNIKESKTFYIEKDNDKIFIFKNKDSIGVVDVLLKNKLNESLLPKGRSFFTLE